MSTTLLSAFYDIDFLCKSEKALTNLSSMLDKKAVGTPVTSPSSSFAPGFLRRHSTSNLQALANSSKFPSSSGSSSSSSSSSSSFGSLKETGTGGGSSSPTALLNKENKFRDRSFSENGERSQHLMQQLQQQAGKGGGGAPINSTRYKTELCRPFEESGACKYGEKCQFAHGFHELRSLTRHPKYKTELCRTFHTIGFCPYGPRCHFIHNADERRPAPRGTARRPTGDLRASPPRDPPGGGAVRAPARRWRAAKLHTRILRLLRPPQHGLRQQPGAPGGALLESPGGSHPRRRLRLLCDELSRRLCQQRLALSRPELGTSSRARIHTQLAASPPRRRRGSCRDLSRCQQQPPPPGGVARRRPPRLPASALPGSSDPSSDGLPHSGSLSGSDPHSWTGRRLPHLQPPPLRRLGSVRD
uniref:mRNA decay activator protein ZFP36 n=1 Tax=Chelonoidis abingdonii TaxID=106734 RepID=A0A8C0HET6_CHEAB